MKQPQWVKFSILAVLVPATMLPHGVSLSKMPNALLMHCPTRLIKKAKAKQLNVQMFLTIRTLTVR